MEITEYKNELELKYYFTRNKDRFLCGCGKVIVKGSTDTHFKTRNHILNNKDFFTIYLCKDG